MMKLFLFALMVFISGCDLAKPNQHLGGQYFYENGDYAHAYISKKVASGMVVAVDQVVVGYETSENHVFVLRKIANSYECRYGDGDLSIITKYTDKVDYWIIDTKEGREYGPFDRLKYIEEGKLLGIKTPDIEADKNYRSNEGDFMKNTAKCVELTPI